MFEDFSVGSASPEGVSIHYRKGGAGPPLLLLHGYPQTHAMWHKIAPRLAQRFTVVCPDTRGYGASGKPVADAEDMVYSKRTMAKDMAGLMRGLGFDKFSVCGHDRGARVAYRLALDHPDAVQKLCVLDILPTYSTWRRMEKGLALGMYHWQFLAQGGGLPEKMLGADPDYYLLEKLKRWSKDFSAFAPEALEAYKVAFRDPASIAATCADYRAGATADDAIDGEDFGRRKIVAPTLVLWGEGGLARRVDDPLAIWRQWAIEVSGHALKCGHFLPEEAPDATAAALEEFLGT
ncbi:MAG: alpha/beta hydrolase [Magnetospirillum sp.]|nr:alpha/beta hydrolase [Magnetospirillum sp.]